MILKKTLWIFALAGLILLCLPFATFGQTSEVAALKKEIRVLKEQMRKLTVEVRANSAVRPTFTGFMPQFSERFHVLHQAGEAGDWAVASHELLELKRLMVVAMAIDAQKGQLMATFLNASLDKINVAIEHGNGKLFLKALDETVVNCNTCHKAVGSGFIRITLNADEMLSMRHSHAFQKSKITGMKMHKH